MKNANLFFMFEIFAINFSVTKAMSLQEKYAVARGLGGVGVLYEKVKQGQYQDLAPCLTHDYGKRIYEITCRHEGQLFVWGQKKYPQKLIFLEKPPLVLYILGHPLSENQPLISVIGTRKPTRYGLRVTKEIVSPLADIGVGIVSGMARGIDACAHQVTLDKGGYTTVVLGHGLDHTYPKENFRLKRAILDAGGTLVSEYPWGTPPLAHHFRDRNRINAALSDGVLVVEAGQKSGTKITVHEGLLLNKRIYSIPGPIDSKMSMFPNQLILEGANMVTSAQDILDDLGLQNNEMLKEETKIVPASDLEKQLLSYFDVDESKSIDSFFEDTNFGLPEIVEKVSEFEIRMIVEKLDDGTYVLCQRP